MDIRFNVTGSQRKALVMAVSEITGWEAVYQKAPTFAYVVNNYTIDKDGTLILDERTDTADVHRLLKELAEQGFTSDDVFDTDDSDVDESDCSVEEIEDISNDAEREAPEAALETVVSVDAPDTLCIELPLAGFTAVALTNLDRLVESKAALIRKSIGTDSLEIEQNEDNLSFPWFPADASAEEAQAYTQLIHALCEQAKKQKRVTAKEKPVASEKYAFRCFLLRLGFIGAEYATARKVLLRNLSGDSSFKNGKRTAQEALTSAQIADNGVPAEVLDTFTDSDNAAYNAAENGATGEEESLADTELVYNVNQSFGGVDDE